MVLLLEDSVGPSFIFLVTIAISTATIHHVGTRFTEKKRVVTNHTTLHNISDILCVRKCLNERQNGMCTLAGYNKATQTCYLSVDDPHYALNSPDEMAGVFFYEGLIILKVYP